jgi:tetratricopeptide (TPR) repeat protein
MVELLIGADYIIAAMDPAYWLDFNDQWDYSDPRGTELKFRALLEQSKDKSQDYILQLRTQIARSLGLRGLFAEAHVELDAVERDMRPGSLVEVRYLLERGRTLNSDKKPEAAMLLFLRASNLAQSLGADFFAVDALHMLGIVAPEKDQLTWNLKGIEYAEASTDERGRGWLASLYNNTAWTYMNDKRYAQALDLFQKAVPLREHKNQQEETRIAKWSVGRCLRAMGQLEQAMAIQHRLEADGWQDGFLFEELAEILYAQGKIDDAKPYFAQAFEELAKLDWIAEDKARLERLKRLS